MNKRKPAYLVIIFLVVFNSNPREICGQANLPEGLLKPLTIGDTVPDVVLENIINYPSSSARLSDFKGRLLILDFWATWCTACLKHFPKLRLLQDAFPELSVFLVNSANTGDTRDKAEAFFRRQSAQEGMRGSLPAILYDSVLTRLFPHGSIPHYVWIYNGKFIAATYPDALTINNVKSVLSGNADLPQKRDIIDFDISKPIYANHIPAIDTSLVYQGSFTRYIPGLTSMKGMVRAGNKRKLYFINRPILNIYAGLLKFEPNHVVIEASDPSKYYFDEQTIGDEHVQEWSRLHCYCVEFYAPLTESLPQASQKMLDFVNLSLGLYGRVEPREMPVRLLKLEASRAVLNSAIGKAGDRITLSVAALVKKLNYYPEATANKPIYANADAETERLQVTVTKDALNNFDLLVHQLQRYNISITDSTLLLPVFVLTERSLDRDKEYNSTQPGHAK